MMNHILGATAIVLSMACASAQEPEPARKGDKWEYGELQYRNGAKLKFAKWVPSRGAVEAEDWEGLASKLKAPAAEKGAKGLTHQLRVMDALGKQGWEVAMYRDGSQITEIWTFKRRIVAK